ncbi:MAG: SDR family oxidoreductase [Bacteroidetes bacterium]|nr:SDR family oxidoreductase [Bacteroidota bacterium]
MKKVVFITGISSGFGQSIAEQLAAKEYIVYGTVRKEAENKPGINVLKMDLMDPASIKSAVSQVLQKEGRIDVLINNAGMHTGGSIETSPVEYAKLQMDTNVMGMVHVLREVLPGMRKQQSGTVINFSSIGGLMGLPFQGFYSASKFAIEGLSEALRMEVKPFGIKVVAIRPGDFHTHNTANRRNYLATDATDPYAGQFKKTLAIIEKDENGGWPPEVLAKKIVNIVEKKNPCHSYVIASMEQKLAVVLKRILPAGWFFKILAPHYGIK